MSNTDVKKTRNHTKFYHIFTISILLEDGTNFTILFFLLNFYNVGVFMMFF